ncbi:MAG: hypothetical protein COV43_01965 [Deltaproteobacteria bacterium CG11_big_fil_rev_8_21_14_0_20_42_23]|nr:MAG: hypothetical protein COV43_01965 [Deltaproteobacteria bacterium CG11_big_fil_rev_8_21_14_0_20_42_23]PJC63879.1 MAG: hypothetical protein CO021_07145 [Deltaproteobacteria bacterium CG_4_9_14_0_2_um_filter_42_21]
MKSRYYSEHIESIAFSDHKMVFLSGPRQSGKTTLSKILLKKRKLGSYHNWDDISFRRIWTKDPKQIVPAQTKNVPLVILDEIHKAKSWKRSLKGIYDTLEYPVDLLVTGSARLNVYKKGGDSLLGRYYHFRLHPFSLAELTHKKTPTPDETLSLLFDEKPSSQKTNKEILQHLFEYGAFPDPYLAQDKRKAKLWRQDRIERVIREDLRDLSRIPELSQIEMLASLLPERIGSLLSINGLKEDLEVSYDTIKRWLQALDNLYYCFRIKPYSKSIKRSLKKEPKLYLWDHSEIEDKGSRFENLIASHLLKACHFWTDTGEGKFDLCYLRNKEKQEIDFLITKDNKPWLPLEVKSQSTTPAPTWKKLFPQLACKRGIQIVSKENIWKSTFVEDKEILIASASEVLSCFV